MNGSISEQHAAVAGFVVLHYLDGVLTQQCVDSIRALNPRQYDIQIAVVDNASPNNSWTELNERYSKDCNVHLIRCQTNAGFAKGNNAGYRWLKQKFDCSFIVICNNDVIFPDSSFVLDIDRLYKKQAFFVAGPDIVVPATGIHQNPMETKQYGISEIKALEHETQVEYEHLCKKWSIKRSLYALKKIPLIEKMAELRFAKRKMLSPDAADWSKAYFKYPLLHGACLIFSERYIQSNMDAFWPGTFMYCEEVILQHECISKNQSMVYCPEIKVLHLDDGATKAAIKEPIDRRIRVLRESLRSLRNYLSYLDKQSNE